MPLDRVAHYLIEREVGRGGMGVVYRARDERLDRPVAIKAVHPDLADDAELLARMEREARILASLDHPGIARIHGMEIGPGGLRYLVLEWIEGATLADRVATGALPWDECVQIGIEIAEAVQAAHELGIVHRDLKPGNVMLDRKGTVKVLDFGLARRLVTDRQPAGKATGSPSDLSLTRSGAALGTPLYMSPEQHLGAAVDARSDVFGLGCILFECLSATPTFEGADAHEVMAAVLARPPRWAALPAGLPEPVRGLLEVCLAKEPDRRFKSMREVRDSLKQCTEGRSLDGARVPGAAERRPLPRFLSSFVGRQREAADCTALLARTRLVTITGPGGCGKTRLAVHVGSAMPDAAATFVDLTSAQDDSSVIHVLATSFGVRDTPDVEPIVAIERSIGDARLVLILDNCEHVVAGSRAAVKHLLAGCPGLRVLATSRRTLGLPGESDFRIAGLGLPPRLESTSGSLEPSEAMSLFVDRARTIVPDLALTTENARAIAEISHALDGLPLAIELAAARVRVLDVEEIAARLRNRLQVLADAGPDAAPRQHTLQATLQWSYDLLAPEEQAHLRRLSVFERGFTLEAAVALLQPLGEFGTLDALSSLLDKSLLQIDRETGGSRRYRCLETVRAFARDALVAAGEESAARDAHLDHFVEFAERAEPALWDSRQGDWLQKLEREHDNLLAASSWASADAARSVSGLRLAGAVRRFWTIRGHYSLGRRVLERAIHAAGGVAASAALGQALDGAGNLALLMGDYAAAQAWFERSLETHRAIGDAQGMSRAYSGRGHLHMQRAEYPEARAAYQEVLRISRESGDRNGIAAALGNLSGVALLEQDFRGAETLLAEATDCFREIGNEHHLALALTTSTVLAIRRGDLPTARGRLVESLPIVVRLRARRLEAAALEAGAEYLESHGRPIPATRLFAAAETVRNQVSAPLGPRELDLQNAILARLRRDLGEDAFREAWSAGGTLDPEGAIKEAQQDLEA